MLKIQSRTKYFGNTQALDSISFESEGGVIGIVGPNGSGKSTLLAIIAGAVKTSSGKIFIDEYDISEYPTDAKRATGYLMEDNPLYDDMTPYEHLMLIGEAKNIPSEKLHRQASEALELLGIDNVKDVLIANIKKGQRQLLGVAAALLGNPDIIVLDEPLRNTNADEAEKLSHVIKMLGTMKTVIISSEETSRIAGICDKIISLSDSDTDITKSDTNKEEEECEE